MTDLQTFSSTGILPDLDLVLAFDPEDPCTFRDCSRAALWQVVATRCECHLFCEEHRVYTLEKATYVMSWLCEICGEAKQQIVCFEPLKGSK